MAIHIWWKTENAELAKQATIYIDCVDPETGNHRF